MSDFLKFLDSADKVLLVFGVCLISLGVIAPKTFLGIDIDWRRAKVISAVIFGMIFIILSLPSVRALGTGNNTDTAVAALDNIRRIVANGRSDAYGASTNTSDLRGCLAASTTSYRLLDEALRQIDALKGSIAPPPPQATKKS